MMLRAVIFKSICILCLLWVALPARMYAQTGLTGQETILFKEEFDDNDKQWPIINHGDTAFTQVENGHYILNIMNSSRWWALRLGILSGLSQEPNVLEMKMKITTDALPVDYGIIWNTVRQSTSVFNENVFLISNTREYCILKKENDTSYTLRDWTNSASIKINDYNVLRVEQEEDGTHTFYINNHKVTHGILPKTNLASYGFYVDAKTILSIDYVMLAVKK
ncbi:MAG TPA: hypothetical protein VIM79_15615 [Niastella sp.]